MEKIPLGEIECTLTQLIYEQLLELFKKENLKIVRGKFINGWQQYQILIKC